MTVQLRTTNLQARHGKPTLAQVAEGCADWIRQHTLFEAVVAEKDPKHVQVAITGNADPASHFGVYTVIDLTPAMALPASAAIKTRFDSPRYQDVRAASDHAAREWVRAFVLGR